MGTNDRKIFHSSFSVPWFWFYTSLGFSWRIELQLIFIYLLFETNKVVKKHCHLGRDHSHQDRNVSPVRSAVTLPSTGDKWTQTT